MPSWKVVIPVVYPSANVLLRQHWAKRRSQIGKWAMVLQALMAHVPPASGRRRFVRITRYGKRELDPANAWTGADKLIVDNLVRLGYLVDDSRRWLTLSVLSRKGQPERTEIEIRDPS